MGKCLWAQFWFGFRGPEKTREVGTWFISSLALQLGSVMALGCSCQLLTSPVARKWREKSTRHIVEMWSEVLRLFWAGRCSRWCQRAVNTDPKTHSVFWMTKSESAHHPGVTELPSYDFVQCFFQHGFSAESEIIYGAPALLLVITAVTSYNQIMLATV